MLYINMWFIIILFPVKRRRHLLEHMIGHFLKTNFCSHVKLVSAHMRSLLLLTCEACFRSHAKLASTHMRSLLPLTCEACFRSHAKLASAHMQSLLPLTCEAYFRSHALIINHTRPPTQPRISCIF